MRIRHLTVDEITLLRDAVDVAEDNACSDALAQVYQALGKRLADVDGITCLIDDSGDPLVTVEGS